MKFITRLRPRFRRTSRIPIPIPIPNPNPIPFPIPSEQQVTDTNRHHIPPELSSAVAAMEEAEDSSSSSSSSEHNYNYAEIHPLTNRCHVAEAVVESSSSPSSSQLNNDEIDQPVVNQTTLTEETGGDVRKRNGAVVVVDGPPLDDCCPICFGEFVAPCRAACGHWYCGGCILEYWNHVAAFRPCKCPMCSRQITKLMPEPSLYQQEDVEVSAVLKNVQQYNRLFVGGIFGFLLKLLQFPLFMKKVLQAMMDPDRPAAYLGRLRLFAVFLGALYTLSPFDFLPTGRRVDAIDLFDYSAIALSFILYFVGLYRQRRRLQNVRQLAGGIQP